MSDKSKGKQFGIVQKPKSKNKAFLKSITCASRGFLIAFKSERNFKIHIVSLFLVVALGLYLDLSIAHWSLIVLSIGFVLVSELFNTSVERLGDEAANGKINQVVRNSKDISAAAVLLSALTAFIIGILILFIPLIQKLF